MAQTIIENKTENIYGITPEVREKYRQKLEQMIQEKGLKAFKTKDELYKHSESGQTQEETKAEVDEFLRLREEWREEDRKLREERENEFGG